jgi:ribosome-binding ATPase YchF (GTP1/OBG family)
MLVAVLEKCLPSSTRQAGARARPVEGGMGQPAPFCLITAKPVLYVANVAEDGFENNPHLDAGARPCRRRRRRSGRLCAAIEAEIADLEDDDKQMFLRPWAWTSPASTA